MRLQATVNGRPFDAEAPATASLLDVLRDAGLTGTKEGCRIGVCGVCTVIVDGLPVSSCLHLAGCVQGADVWTVEGVTQRQPEVVDAFVACEGMQCGICTPGQVVAAASMGPEVQGEDAIRRYLSGNLCRCTGYASIVEAVRTYQEARRDTRSGKEAPAGTEPARARRPPPVPDETAFIAGETAFVSPATVEEAVGVLADSEAVVLAGGTSVGMLVGQRLIEPSVLVWLRRIPELQGISRHGDRIVLGACVTLRELLADNNVEAAFPAVTSAAAAVGNTRIRAVATVGGALAHTDPRQDLPPALLAHDAEVELASVRGRRRLPLSKMASGFMTTVLEPDELITAVSIPIVASRRSSYRRYAPGSTDDFPTVSVAAAMTVVRETITSARVAVGGVGPTAYLVPEAASLIGGKAPPEARAAVARAAAERSSPTDDRLGSAAYKRAVVPVWVERALTSCLAEPSPACAVPKLVHGR